MKVTKLELQDKEGSQQANNIFKQAATPDVLGQNGTISV